jgi:hypothetical protein
LSIGVQREQVWTALEALAQAVTFTLPGAAASQGFVTVSRRLRSIDQVPVEQRPALFQVEKTEKVTQVTRMPTKRRWAAWWIIYHAGGANQDPSQPIGAQTNSAILDALESVIPVGDPEHGPEIVQTLGGLVHSCFIDGTIQKESGDLDSWGLIVVPLTLIVP